jgi:hypothetical protein
VGLFTNKAKQHAEALLKIITLFRVVRHGISVSDLMAYSALNKVEVGVFEYPSAFSECAIFPLVSLTCHTFPADKTQVESLQIMSFDELKGFIISIGRDRETSVNMIDGGKDATILAVRTISHLLKKAKQVTPCDLIKGTFYCDFGM